jgi:hypothetical protein
LFVACALLVRKGNLFAGRRAMSRPDNSPAPARPTAQILPFVKPRRKVDPTVMRRLRLLVDIWLTLIEGDIPVSLAGELVHGYATRHMIDGRMVLPAFKVALEINAETTGRVWSGGNNKNWGTGL